MKKIQDIGGRKEAGREFSEDRRLEAEGRSEILEKGVISKLHAELVSGTPASNMRFRGGFGMTVINNRLTIKNNFFGLLTLIASTIQSSLSTRRKGEEGESTIAPFYVISKHHAELVSGTPASNMRFRGGFGMTGIRLSKSNNIPDLESPAPDNRATTLSTIKHDNSIYQRTDVNYKRICLN